MMIMVYSLIDPGKKAMVLQRIRERKEPLCAALKPEPEPLVKTVKKKARKKPVIDFDAELIKAVRDRDEEKVERFLKKGADVEARDENDWTTLMLASFSGYTKIVSLLVDKYHADVNARNNGITALMWAASTGHANTVKILLSRNADVNAKSDNGATALMYAAEESRTETAKLLIDANADVNAKDKIGWTALIKAKAGGRPEMYRMMELLINSKADVNAKDHHGSTVLTHAAQHGNEGVIRLLINSGAKLNIKDNEGHTALWWARVCKEAECAKLLRENGGR